MTKESDALKMATDRAFAILQIRLQDFAMAQQALMQAFQAERNHYSSLLDIQEKVTEKPVKKKEGVKKHAKKPRSVHRSNG